MNEITTTDTVTVAPAMPDRMPDIEGHFPTEIEATYLNQVIDVDGEDAVVLDAQPLRNGSGREIGTAYTIDMDAWVFVQDCVRADESTEIAEQHEADQLAEAEDGHEAAMAQVDDTGRADSCECGAWADPWGDHRRAGCLAEDLPAGVQRA